MHPLYWLAPAIAVHLLFWVSLYTGWLNRLFNDASHTGQAFDFAVYYISGKALAAGQDVYGVKAAFGFRYLPVFGYTVARFLALFEAKTAYYVYLLITEALLLLNLRLVWRWVSDDATRVRMAAMWLVFSPFYLELYIGQISYWAASLLFWALYATAHGVGRGEVLAWVGACLLKPNALLLAPAYVRARRWKALGFCGAALAATSLPYFWAFPQGWSVFWQRNLGGGGVEGALTHAGNIGWWGTLVSLGAKLAGMPLERLAALEQLPGLVQGGVWVGVGAVAAVSLWATFGGRRPDHLELLCLWMTAFFLLYKDVWEHHLVFLLPVLVALYAQTRQRSLLWIFALVALPTPYVLLDVSPEVHGNIDPERGWSVLTSLVYRSATLVPVAALWGWLALRLGRQGEAGPADG